MDGVALVRLALGIITDRLITILGLISSSVMCGWTMWGPTWERVICLAIFVIYAYAVVTAKERKDDVRPREETRQAS